MSKCASRTYQNVLVAHSKCASRTFKMC